MLCCCHLQARKVASEFGGEVLLVFGGVLSTAAARMADEDASKEGCYVSSLDVPSANPNRRLCIVKKAAGAHWQRAMEAGDQRMKMATMMLAQTLHKGIKDEVQASQPGVSYNMPQLSGLAPFHLYIYLAAV
jgi:hypothetical protein